MDYQDMTAAEIRAELKARGLTPTTLADVTAEQRWECRIAPTHIVRLNNIRLLERYDDYEDERAANEGLAKMTYEEFQRMIEEAEEA